MKRLGTKLILAFVVILSPIHAQLPASISLDSLNGLNGFKVTPRLSSDFFSSSLSDLGDINGDGIDDVAFGDPSNDSFIGTDTGSAYVLFGKSEAFQNDLNLNNLNGTNGIEIIGEAPFGQAGWSVASAGDVNNDGLNDIILGALTTDNGKTINTGAAYVIYGNSSGLTHPFFLADLDGTNGFKIYGITQDDTIGRSVNTIGDVNMDTIDDIIICATHKTVNMLIQAGMCYVIFGNDSIDATFDLELLNGNNGFTIKSSTANEKLGYQSGSAGDFNDDGIDDIILGTGNSNNAYIIYGKSTAFQAEINLSNLNGSNGFTVTSVNANSVPVISHAGDINNDGISDVIVGVPDTSNWTGAAYVLFGDNMWPQTFNLQNTDATNSFTIFGAANNDMTGTAVSKAGDVNNDGIDDFIVGSTGANQFNGLSHVIYGSENLSPSLSLSDLNSANAFIIIGENTNGGSSGRFVSSAGDLNNDGTSDIIISAPIYNKSYVVLSNDVIYSNGFE